MRDVVTPQQARELAARIKDTWAAGPKLEVWADELLALDAGTAGTAYIRLRRESEHAPSIARFVSVYHSLHTVSTDPIDVCPDCGNSGWVETRPLHVENPFGPDPISYSQVQPCTRSGCPVAEHATRLHRSISRANDHASARLRPLPRTADQLSDEALFDQPRIPYPDD